MNYFDLSRDELTADVIAAGLYTESEVEDLEDWQLEAAIRGESEEQAAIRRLDLLADY